jgi:hypothetical protein
MPVIVENEIKIENIADLNEIEGSEINVAFDKSDVDEALPNSEEVLVGNVEILAASDYEITELRITVTGKAKDAIEELELDGSTSDGDADINSDRTIYTFEDISLSKGEALSLPITIDIVEGHTFDNKDLEIEVEFVEIEDEINDITYTINDSSTKKDDDIENILSVNTFNTKKITITSGNFEITNVMVIDRDLVIGSGVETVIYKAKISIGDADDLTVDDLEFKLSTTGHNIVDTNGSKINLDDVIASSTINIGGNTFK